MNLLRYLQMAPRGTARRIAERLRVAPALVAQWKAGTKRPSVELAIELEVVTEGWVRVEDSRPDINWQVVRRQRRKAA